MELPLAVIGGVGWQELVIILVIVLLVFGPKRLPDIADAIGKSIKKFRRATQDASDEVKRELDAARRDVDGQRDARSHQDDRRHPGAGPHPSDAPRDDPRRSDADRDDAARRDDHDEAGDAPPTRP